MGKVLILGSGEMGKQIHHFLTHYSEHVVYGFLDDFDKSESVLGKINHIDDYKNIIDYLAIGIGYNHLNFKADLFLKFKNKGFEFLTYIHPTSSVDKTASIGEGSLIYPGVIIDQGVKVGDNTIINNGAILSHDCQIGSHSFIAPGVVFSGNCNLGNKCFIGSGTIFKDHISVVDEVVIGAGSLVIKSIEKNGQYFGHPIG